MDEGCLLFILEAFGSFLFDLLGTAWRAGWDFSTGVAAWLYREGPPAVLMGARLGLLAGFLWGIGLGFRLGPALPCPPAFSAVVVALVTTPLLGLAGGLIGWAFRALSVRR